MNHQPLEVIKQSDFSIGIYNWNSYLRTDLSPPCSTFCFLHWNKADICRKLCTQHHEMEQLLPYCTVTSDLNYKDFKTFCRVKNFTSIRYLQFLIFSDSAFIQCQKTEQKLNLYRGFFNYRVISEAAINKCLLNMLKLQQITRSYHTHKQHPEEICPWKKNK